MDKVNLPFFVTLGAQMQPLTKPGAEGGPRSDVVLAAFIVRDNLRILLESTPLPVCRKSGVQLLEAIVGLSKWFETTKAEEWGKPITLTDFVLRQVVFGARQFQSVMQEELLTLPAYIVGQKGIYQTDALIERAEKTLPPAVLSKVSQQVIEDIRACGQCLAFDVPTAAGFHIIRATETVLHHYYVAVCKPGEDPAKVKTLENWGEYISELYKKGETDSQVKEVVALLQQFKDRHRNLIMHPEVTLTQEEALTLFEIAKGAIMAMATRLPNANNLEGLEGERDAER